MRLEPAPSERMTYRRWTLVEAPDGLEMYSDPEVVRYIGGRLCRDEQEARDLVQLILDRNRLYPPGTGSWMARDKATDRLQGSLLLKPIPLDHRVPTEDIEVGWHLPRRVWGQGFATEMGRAGLRHGFEVLNLEKIHAVIEPPNVRSIAVAQRLGLSHHGQTTRWYRGIELEHFSITREEWRASLQ